MSEANPRASARWQLALLLGGLALILLAAFPYFEQIRNANEVPRLLQAMALVEQGEWAIDGPSRRGIALGPDIAKSPVDQRVYPNKPPGASVVGAVAYVVARSNDEPPSLRRLTWWARLLAGVVPVLLIAGVAWRRLLPRYGAWVAGAAVCCLVLGTPLFAYARLFYGHALAACLLYLGVVGIEAGRGEHQVGRSLMWIGFGGLCAAAAITVEYGAAFAGLPIAAFLLVPALAPGAEPAARRRSVQQSLVGLAFALVPVVLLALYQREVFGSMWATGYHHAADPGFAKLHGQGLLGLGRPRWANVETHWFSPNTGLLAWSPLVLVGLVGLVRVARRAGPMQAAGRLQLSVFGIIALMGLGLSFAGGWRIGPRYLVVVLPLLGLGLAEVFEGVKEQARPLAAGLGVGLLGLAASWSLLANSLAATFWPHIDPTNISEPFGAVLLPLWREGFAPYGLPTWFEGGATSCLLAPVFVGLGAVLGACARSRPRLLALPLVLGAAAGVLVVAIVIPRSVDPHPKSERNLNYIQRVYEPGV